MALEILYGKQQKNKDSFLFSKIKECIDSGQDVLYIVPEQYSFNADKNLLNMLGEKYTHLTETVNFKRLATVVNKRFEKDHLDYIDDEIKTLILYKIIKENSELLSTVKNRKNSPDSVMIFKNILSECKGHLIGHETLEAIKSNLEKGTFLYQKISDLDFILTHYQTEISEKFKDFEDSFQILASNINEHGLYQDFQVFIDHFISFSPAEYQVISALLKQAKNVFIPLLLDDISEKEPGDLFFPTYRTYQQLLKLSKAQNQTASIKKAEDTSDNFFCQLFDGIPDNQPTLNITMVNAKNQQDEIRFVVDTIQKKVSEGASYSDFTVLTGDLGLYQNDIEKIFSDTRIPCFIDCKTPLTENPISKIILTMFSMVLSGYTRESVTEYLKSLCSVYDVHDEICIFEELLCRFHIQKNDITNLDRWNQKCEFFKTQKNYYTDKLDIIQKVYQRFLLPVIQHFHHPENYLNAFQNYTKELKLEQAVRAYLEQTESALRQETAAAYNIILTAIKNIDILIGTDKIKPVDYLALLRQSLELYETGEVPDTLDTVTVSDIDRGRSLSSPYVFIIGLNEGVTPKASDNTTYLSDLERETIAEITGIDLPTSLYENCSSMLALYRAFLTAEQHLYLSKNDAESDTEKKMPSFIWTKLQHFSDVMPFDCSMVNQTEYTQQAVMAFSNPYKQRLSPKKIPDELLADERKTRLQIVWQKLDSMKQLNYFETKKKLSRKILDSKYQKQLNASVSRLETYQKCGYAYFINYMLKIRERENISYDPRKTGSIIHSLLDRFSKSLKADNKTWETIDEAYIEAKIEVLVPKEIQRIAPDLSLFNSRTKYLIKKLKRLLRNAVSFISEQYSQGEFVPVGYEISFDENGIPPLTIALEDGSVMQMYGTIDRCDVAKAEDRLYVRIIDYKSSAKEFNFTLIKDGIQLQLLTYLRTVVKNGGEYLNFTGEILPGAAFYTNFGDSVVSFKERPAPDEVMREIRKKFSMKGFVLNDDSLIRAIDRQLGELPSYHSEVCDIRTDRNGQYKLKNLLFLEEFNRLLNDCEETIQTIGNKIQSGDIAIKPYRYGTETGCDWCPYASVCMFDPKMHTYRNLKKLSKEDYFETDSKEETAGENSGN
ncbi:MAG: PD-(D/E)XK nuclease family protein [Clostridia bacterium]|nr:PD-(D/E)XK nuclease family protein [Clostridia bacterium]